MRKIMDTANTVFRSVGLAMGIATTVLLIIERIETSNALLLLAIGLASLGISTLTSKKV